MEAKGTRGNNMRKLLPLFFVVLLLVSCSSGKSKPSDVSQEIWDQGIQYTIIIKDFYNSDVNAMETAVPDLLINFKRDYEEDDKLSENEVEIIRGVVDLGINWLTLGVRNTGASKKDFDDQYNKLNELFGEKNLEIDNLDVSLIGLEESIDLYDKANVESEVSSSTVTVDTIKQERSISLTNKDVQFDMVNNLDMEFAIVGIAEIDDYYNYGFTNEEKYFVARVTPDGGSYTESWYLYFHRESFAALYDNLKSGNYRIKATAKVPSNVYKSGQGNMAQVTWAGIVN